MNNNLKICLIIYITMSAIPNLESKSASEKRATTSSDIPRLHKDDDEVALAHRKILLKMDAEDRKKIREGTYQGDPSKWQPRVKSKYMIPFTPDGLPDAPIQQQASIQQQETVAKTTPGQVLEALEINEFDEETEAPKKETRERETRERETPQERLNNLIKLFYANNPYTFNPSINHELEVKFGTKDIRDIKKLTRNDYDNVIKKLKSSGFNVVGDSNGQYYLRIYCEFRDNDGQQKLSNVRTEIKGF